MNSISRSCAAIIRCTLQPCEQDCTTRHQRVFWNTCYANSIRRIVDTSDDIRIRELTPNSTAATLYCYSRMLKPYNIKLASVQVTFGRIRSPDDFPAARELAAGPIIIQYVNYSRSQCVKGRLADSPDVVSGRNRVQIVGLVDTRVACHGSKRSIDAAHKSDGHNEFAGSLLETIESRKMR